MLLISNFKFTLLKDRAINKYIFKPVFRSTLELDKTKIGLLNTK